MDEFLYCTPLLIIVNDTLYTAIRPADSLSGDSFFAHDGCAVHAAARILVVRNDAVHTAAVVPDDQITFRPFMAVGEGRLRGPFLESHQERAAMRNRLTGDTVGVRADHQGLTPRVMSPHQRMGHDFRHAV